MDTFLEFAQMPHMVFYVRQAHDLPYNSPTEALAPQMLLQTMTYLLHLTKPNERQGLRANSRADGKSMKGFCRAEAKRATGIEGKQSGGRKIDEGHFKCRAEAKRGKNIRK